MSAPTPESPEASRESASPEETERLGALLAGAVATGDAILLTGPLGAGKTCLVAGLARGLGCVGRVRSPSFTLINEYPGPIPLFHIDLYRLEGPEAEDLGLEERLDQGVLAAEWGERLPAGLRSQALTLTFAVRSERVRVIRATAGAGRGRDLLAAWRGMDARIPGGR